MVFFVCKCGKRKSGPPHKSARTLPMVCDACRDRNTIAGYYYGRRRSHGETGRRKGLKIPRS